MHDNMAIVEEGLNGRTLLSVDLVIKERCGITGLKMLLMSHKPIDCVVVMLGTNELKKFFPASAEHPFSPVVQVCQRANKLQTAIIRIKKISPYDTERQTYQQNELHSFSSSYRIKKGGKSNRDYSRFDCRGASLGDTETDLPRCWVDNLNPHGSGDNLLDNDTLKYLRLWQRTQ